MARSTLPPELETLPGLGEYYGKAAWSAQAYATGNPGWDDGSPTNLGTLSTAARARAMAELAGGIKALARAADPQRRAELYDHLLALDHPAQAMKADTLEALIETEINATARIADLWGAKRLREGAPRLISIPAARTSSPSCLHA